MKPLNIFVALCFVAIIPLSASADRSGSRYGATPRCGNDRNYNSYNPGWGGNWGGNYAGWGNVPANPYGGPRSWNSGSWSSGGWGKTGYGYGAYSYGAGRPGIYRTDQIIRNGVRSGALSRDEVRDIREDQRDIRQKEQRYWSDGWLSSRERNDLRGDYKDLNKDIRHNLNDGERRFRTR